MPMFKPQGMPNMSGMKSAMPSEGVTDKFKTGAPKAPSGKSKVKMLKRPKV